MEQIPYDTIKNTAPYGLEKTKEPSKLNLWKVLVFFAALMAVFVFFGSYIQYRLGMGGVVITELMFLAASILFVRLQKILLRQVFPLHRPKGLALGSTAVLWAAAYLSMIIVNLILAYFYPAGVLGSGNSANLVITSIPWGIAFLVVAVLPAVCEEALHRGVIQYGVQNSLRNPWLIVLLMGLLFGAFHVSIWKFLPTAMLGAAMSYLLLRTGNMVYSCFFHFLHNGIQMLLLLPSGYMMGAVPASSLEELAYGYLRKILPVSIGLYLCFGAIIPFLFYLSHWMLIRCQMGRPIPFLPWGPARKKTLLWILIPTFVLLAAGCLTLMLSISSLAPYPWFSG